MIPTQLGRDHVTDRRPVDWNEIFAVHLHTAGQSARARGWWGLYSILTYNEPLPVSSVPRPTGFCSVRGPFGGGFRRSCEESSMFGGFTSPCVAHNPTQSGRLLIQLVVGFVYIHVFKEVGLTP